MRYFIFVLFFLSLIHKVNSQSEMQINNPKLGLGQIEKIFFVSENIGYCIGSFGKLGKTTNGGVNWELVNTESIGIKFEYFASLYFIDEEIGYLIAKNGDLFKTTNGGETLNKLIHFDAQLYESPFIHFFSENKGIIKFIYRDQDIYTTIDGGLTWEQKSSSPKGVAFHVLNETTFYGNDGDSICKTIDGGETWTNISALPYHILSIQFVNDSVGFVHSYFWDDFYYSQSFWENKTDGNQTTDQLWIVNDCKIFPIIVS